MFTPKPDTGLKVNRTAPKRRPTIWTQTSFSGKCSGFTVYLRRPPCILLLRFTEALSPLGRWAQACFLLPNSVEFLLKNESILPPGQSHGSFSSPIRLPPDFDPLIVSLLYVLRASERWWKLCRTQFCIQRLFMSSPLTHTLNSACAIRCDDVSRAPSTQWARRAASLPCACDCRLLIQLCF